MNRRPGRPKGSKNKPGHKAGRPAGTKNKQGHKCGTKNSQVLKRKRENAKELLSSLIKVTDTTEKMAEIRIMVPEAHKDAFKKLCHKNDTNQTQVLAEFIKSVI